jgi:hypothetical protein
MNGNLTNEIIKLGSNEQSMKAIRQRRAEIFAAIQTAENEQRQIPDVQLRAMLNELFDLNIAIGDVDFEDKDGEQ